MDKKDNNKLKNSSLETKNKKNRNRKKKGKHNKKKSMWPVLILLIIGLLVISYPFIASYYNHVRYKRISAKFDKNVQSYSDIEIRNKIELERDYNDFLLDPNNPVKDTQKRYKKGIAEYNRLMNTGELLGYINVPRIDQTLPIYVGDTDAVLERGIGVMSYTSLPIGGIGTHCVLTGHSAIPTARLFTDLDKMKVGDEFFIHNVKEVLAYRVDKIQVILPTNFAPLKIFKDKDYCTLLTCTPYMINTHRLLVRGVRVPYNKQMEKTNSHPIIKILLILLIILILILLWYLWKRRKKNKEKGKNLIEKQ